MHYRQMRKLTRRISTFNDQLVAQRKEIATCKVMRVESSGEITSLTHQLSAFIGIKVVPRTVGVRPCD